MSSKRQRELIAGWSDIHQSSTATRKVLLDELRELLGPLNEDVAAEWITQWILQRRDAELEEIQRREQQLYDDDSAAATMNGDGNHQLASEEADGIEREEAVGEAVAEEAQDGTIKVKKRHQKRKSQRRKEHSEQLQAAATESAGAADKAEPEQSTATAAVLPHGMEEIDIGDVDADDQPTAASVPLPAYPTTVKSPSALAPFLPQPPPPPLPPRALSREQLLSALTFLLPDRDPAFYAGWPDESVLQRIQSSYSEQLADISAETVLSPSLLFSFAHLLSPLLFPSSPPAPPYVDAAVTATVVEISRHIRLAIEHDTRQGGIDEGKDEARLALTQVLRVSAMIGMSADEAEWIRQWIHSVTPVASIASSAAAARSSRHALPLLPLPPPPSRSAGTSSPSPSPLPPPSPALGAADDNGHSAAGEAGDKPTIASLTHLSLSKAVSLVKPRFIVLDGANIGRWSGSGDPSTEITVSTALPASSLPSHLQHLPTSTAASSRNMIRLDSWQIAAAVIAVESTLHTAALICLPEQYVRRPERFGVRDVELLLLLQRQGKLHRLPAGADDDSQMIALANDAGSWVVTNDNLRDHVYSGLVSKDWLSSRLIKYYTVVYPKLGDQHDGKAPAVDAAAGMKTLDDVKAHGCVCLIEPAAMRQKVISNKERMDAEDAPARPPHPPLPLYLYPHPPYGPGYGAAPYPYYPPPPAPAPGAAAWPPYPPYSYGAQPPPLPSPDYRGGYPLIAPSRWYGGQPPA